MYHIYAALQFSIISVQIKRYCINFDSCDYLPATVTVLVYFVNFTADSIQSCVFTDLHIKIFQR